MSHARQSPPELEVPPLVEEAFVDATLVDAAYRGADALAGDVARIEAEAPDPAQALRAMVQRFGRAGLLRLVVPADDGGAFPRVSFRAVCLARERLGRLSPLADLAFAMQGLGGQPLVLGASGETRSRWLPAIAGGEAVAAFALTEPEAGSDLSGMRARARRDGDHYILDGHKVWISNAGVADVYAVFALTGDEGPFKSRVSAFAVPADTPGLETRPMHVLGGHPIGEVRLEGARVPASARLGDEGRGLGLALGTLSRFRVTVGAAALGFAQRALEESILHVSTRAQFGGPLAELTAVQLRLAEMACDVDASRLLVYRAAKAIDDEAPRAEVARTGSMAKLVATEAAQRVIDHAVQLHGGTGVQTGRPVARLYEEIRALRIYEGTTDVQKVLVAREVLSRHR